MGEEVILANVYRSVSCHLFKEQQSNIFQASDLSPSRRSVVVVSCCVPLLGLEAHGESHTEQSLNYAPCPSPVPIPLLLSLEDWKVMGLGEKRSTSMQMGSRVVVVWGRAWVVMLIKVDREQCALLICISFRFYMGVQCFFHMLSLSMCCCMRISLMSLMRAA